MKVLFRAYLLMFAVFLFVGCGGGSGDGPTLTPGESSGTPDSGGDGGTGAVTETTVVRFGSFTGGTFNAGKIATNKTDLDAGQSASLTVSFIDQNNSPITDPADILFTSPCASAGLSEFDSTIAGNTTGTVSVTYVTRGCDGADIITAQTSLNGTTFSATVTLQTVPAPLGSISFVSATPQIIGIKGSGAIPEQSVVSFLVTNSSGGPVPNQDVTFALNNTTGGITLSNTNDTTDATGLVSTTVASGSIASSVRVTATAIRDGITSSAQSSALAITTGIPDQDSFSLSATILNIEGLEYDGIQTTLTLRTADRYNNPVPDGTAIVFQAEGASVEGSCTTVGGSCSVTMTSQQPRPGDGRVTILASAIGEESFNDANPSNGRYDDAEIFTDLGEAFRDDNENGTYDSPNEPYLDFNSNSTRDAANGLYEGLLCNGPSKCNSNQSTVTISSNIVIVLSGSSFFINVQPAVINLDGGNQTVIVSIQDVNGQVPPAGTSVSVTTDQGSIVGSSAETVLSTNNPGPIAYAFTLKPGAAAGNGTFTVNVITPIGLISRGTADVTQTVVP